MSKPTDWTDEQWESYSRAASEEAEFGLLQSCVHGVHPEENCPICDSCYFELDAVVSDHTPNEVVDMHLVELREQEIEDACMDEAAEMAAKRAY